MLESCPNNAPDGTIFRKDLAQVNNEFQQPIHKGAYPEKRIIELMEQSLNILNNKDIPVLIRISVFHYLFGYIHPFYDGNGRTSRFISSYLLSKEFAFLIGYRLSYTIKENINSYYKAFKECNLEINRGDLTPFIIMFLSIIHESFKNLYDALNNRKIALNSHFEIIKNIPGLSEDDIKFCKILLQAALFSEKGMTKDVLSETLKISLSSVDKRLKKIKEIDLLVLQKGERKHRYSIDLARLQTKKQSL
ncbi:MAG: Fic family protein [Oscillospiraceae bacterium]|nr:Fic family protein [Oscillospiraceae bacterium]